LLPYVQEDPRQLENVLYYLLDNIYGFFSPLQVLEYCMTQTLFWLETCPSSAAYRKLGVLRKILLCADMIRPESVWSALPLLSFVDPPRLNPFLSSLSENISRILLGNEVIASDILFIDPNAPIIVDGRPEFAFSSFLYGNPDLALLQRYLSLPQTNLLTEHSHNFSRKSMLQALLQDLQRQSLGRRCIDQNYVALVRNVLTVHSQRKSLSLRLVEHLLQDSEEWFHAAMSASDLLAILASAVKPEWRRIVWICEAKISRFPHPGAGLPTFRRIVEGILAPCSELERKKSYNEIQMAIWKLFIIKAEQNPSEKRDDVEKYFCFLLDSFPGIPDYVIDPLFPVEANQSTKNAEKARLVRKVLRALHHQHRAPTQINIGAVK
jgi:hypothetical protein